jgi:hypothetical protein
MIEPNITRKEKHQALVDNEFFEPMENAQTSPNQMDMSEVFLDNTFIIDELMNTFQGVVVDSVRNKLTKLKPIISKEASAWLASRVLPYTSKLFSLSKLSEDKIREMVYEFEINLSGDLIFCTDYGISRKDRDYVYTLTIQMMESTLRKAHEGITMIRMLSQHQIKEIKSIQDSSQTEKMTALKRIGVRL